MNIMQINQYHNPGKIIVGAGALKEIVNELKPGSFPLIVTDRGISDSGILDRFKSVLEEEQINYRTSRTTPIRPMMIFRKCLMSARPECVRWLLFTTDCLPR